MVKYDSLLAEQTSPELSEKEREFLKQMEEVTDQLLTERFPASSGWVYVPERNILPLVHTLNHWRKNILVREWKKIYESQEAGWEITDDEESGSNACYTFRKR